MTPDNKPKTQTELDYGEIDKYSKVRRFRLMQICGVTALGLIATLIAARSITLIIFSVALGCLLLALIFAFKHKLLTSAYILLGSLSAMLFSLSLTGAGLLDLAILGYPGLLIFAAILGGVGLFLTVLFFVITQCVFVAWLTLNGIIIPHHPSLTWSHLVFIVVILVVTGFSVFILVHDIKRLMLSLQHENAKVQKSRAEIQHLAHHDPLTNLPNRIYAEELFLALLSDCQTSRQKLAVLFIDLDNFKPVNDALGHAAGDLLLEQLSLKLKAALEPNQHLTRFGGDEFLLLTPCIKNQAREQLDTLAERLIALCASEFIILQNQVVISASIGIACAPKDGTDFKQLCRRADIAMYQAKESGRSTFHYYDASLEQASDDKFKLLQLLRPAILEQQFALYYQPMVNLSTNEITTIEALLRWPQPNGSMINPDQFIPIAESSGLINSLGQWVIEEACRFCAQQRKKGFSELQVAVNLSVIQFKDGKLQQIVENALNAADLPPQGLELELTESLFIDQTEQIQQQLVSLSKLGVTIAIDDFGTGYSNLSYLRHFNASKLKIDRSFITTLSVNKDDEPLVAAIINMASSLGLKTIAEGIEDEATLTKLMALDCAIGQGYYWSKPIPGDELSAFLIKHGQKSSMQV